MTQQWLISLASSVGSKLWPPGCLSAIVHPSAQVLLCSLLESLVSIIVFISGVPEEASLVLELVDIIHDDQFDLLLVANVVLSMRKATSNCQDPEELCAERAIALSNFK